MDASWTVYPVSPEEEPKKERRRERQDIFRGFEIEPSSGGKIMMCEGSMDCTRQ